MSDSAEELIRSGLYGDGKRVEANVRRAIALEPDNAEARFVLGEVLFRARKYDEADQAYRSALACPPCPEGYRPYPPGRMYLSHRNRVELDAAVHYALGNLHRKLGRLEVALEEYRAAVLGSADAGWAFLAMAQIHDQQGRLDLAIQDYRQAVRYDFVMDSVGDMQGDVTSQFAEALFRSGEYPEAAEASRRAIEQGCMDYLGLAGALRKMGNLEGAVLAYREGLIRMPDRPPLRNELAAMLIESGDLAAAIDELQLAVCRHPSRAVFLQLARTQIKLGDLEEAVQVYREALSRYPDCQPAIKGLRRVLAHLQKRDLDQRGHYPRTSRASKPISDGL